MLRENYTISQAFNSQSCCGHLENVFDRIKHCFQYHSKLRSPIYIFQVLIIVPKYTFSSASPLTWDHPTNCLRVVLKRTFRQFQAWSDVTTFLTWAIRTILTVVIVVTIKELYCNNIGFVLHRKRVLTYREAIKGQYLRK